MRGQRVHVAPPENEDWSLMGSGQRGQPDGLAEVTWTHAGKGSVGQGAGSGLRLGTQDLARQRSMTRQCGKTSVGVTKLSLENTAGLLRAFNTFIHIGTSKREQKRYTISQIF